MVNPKVFLPLATLENETADLARFMKDTPTIPGGQPVQYPGEKEAKTRKQRLALGVEVEESTWNRLKALADELGCRFA